MSSKIRSINSRDFLMGLIYAVGTSILMTLKEMIAKGGFNSVDWNSVLTIAVLALITYLLQSFSTDENGKLGGKL